MSQDHRPRGVYRTLAVSTAINFVLMYLAMYMMIDRGEHFYLNLDNVYMTLVMVAAMTIAMMLGMRSMYPNRRRNLAIWIVAGLALVLAYAAIRNQTAIGDRQFLRAMIPHHSSAILMCNKAKLTDPQVKQLCSGIIASQEREITEMKDLLRQD